MEININSKVMRADELTNEEKAILAFLESYFEQHGMRGSLAMLRNVDTKAEGLRAVIDRYRWLHESERK